MTNMVAVFGTDEGIQGEVFPRRALQLIKKQRAVWADEHKRSIKLLPGASLDSDDRYYDEGETHSSDEKRFAGASKALYEAALRRIQERKRFMWHSLALLPGYFLALALAENLAYGRMEDLILGFLTGVGRLCTPCTPWDS